MNASLARLAAELGLDDARHHRLRLAFGLACAQRIEPLLEHPAALAALEVLRDFIAGGEDEAALQRAAASVAAIARSHPGAASIDGAGHAAVSATHALAHVLAGRALQAADYAAYARVYADGGHAVGDPSAFIVEFDWQLQQLQRLQAGSAR
jgi:hypothetical protein